MALAPASVQSRKRTRSITESQTPTITARVVRTRGIPKSVSRLHHMLNPSTPPDRVSRRRLLLPTNSNQGIARSFVNGQFRGAAPSIDSPPDVRTRTGASRTPLCDSPSAAGGGAGTGARSPIPDLGGGWQGPCGDGRFWYGGRDRGRLSPTHFVSCYYHRNCTTYSRVHEKPTANTMIAWLQLGRVNATSPLDSKWMNELKVNTHLAQLKELLRAQDGG